MLNHLAGIASIQLPAGFEKASEDCDFGHFIEYRHETARICYWQKDNFFASEETAQKLEETLKRKPHFIFRRDPKDPMEVKADDDEYFAAAEALLQPGRILPPFGFDIRSMKTQQVSGRTIFRVDFDAGRHFCSILIWDHSPESGILRHLWIDGPVRAEKELQQEFERACESIQWV